MKIEILLPVKKSDIDIACKFLNLRRKLKVGSADHFVVYKIPYRRARAWPLGRVRRASKGILHTNHFVLLIFVQTPTVASTGFRGAATLIFGNF